MDQPKSVLISRNPLEEFLDDGKFRELWDLGFLNERAIRDYYIRKKFWALKNDQKPKQIFTELQTEFSYLSVETIRKIVYSRGLSNGKSDS